MNSRPKILMVDDKPENLLALRTVLKNLEVDLVEAKSGNEALRATLHHDFALALLDIQMPEMDGYELAEILRQEEKTANMPFIFISAVYTDNLNVFKGYEKGAFSFITKPFQPEILINKVKFFMDKHQQENALFRLNEDLRLKNDELKMMNADLESFSYSVSHDLRAPLRAINGYAGIMKQDCSDVLDPEASRLLGIIIDNTSKMANLIDSLLNFSRLGRKEISKVKIDMNDLVQWVAKECGNSAAHRKTELKIGDLPHAWGDKDLLRQVWINLIGNAYKYSAKKENPLVEIGSFNQEGAVVYFVRDNGAGFDMKFKNKLFGVFQRLHSTDDFKGIGIGLAIVQRLVVRHGGTVWAEGEPGVGASFYFSLPEGVEE